MTLGFSQEINNKPNHFIAKLWTCFIPNSCMGSDLSKIVRKYYDYSGAHKAKFGDYFEVLDVKPKLHTIRKGNRWRTGMDIHFVINNRSKDQFQFAPVVKCVSVQIIKIVINDFPFPGRGEPEWRVHGLYVDGKECSVQETIDLAINDGFDSVDDFFAYFDKDFTGQLIHWTDLKYKRCATPANL